MAKIPSKKTVTAKKAATKKVDAAAEKTRSNRTYLSQEDIPAYELDEALLVAKALLQEYGGHAAKPLDVAAAMDLSPSSGKFRMLCGSSIAYGLTSGGCNATQIEPTDLAKQIIEPQEEGADLAGRREAVMKPRVLREFLSKYSGSPLPREDIGHNVLKGMNVPADRLKDVWGMVLRSADSVGFLQTIKDRRYVNLGGVKPPERDVTLSGEGEAPALVPEQIKELVKTVHEPAASAVAQEALHAPVPKNDARLRRVFITHGKNTSFLEPIKELLGFGELIPIVSIHKESVAQPVPDKVMNDMRGCGAAIIHVDGEQKLIDGDAKEHTVINANVLIEIGAAMALYGRRFILLVRDGVKLPSNLQGLYEVRYQGEALDGTVTIRLLKAINELKAVPLPLD